MMDIKRFGDQACIVEFGEGISREINARVVAFHHQLKEHTINGIMDLIPAYNSITILFDPGKIEYSQLSESLGEIRTETSENRPSIFRIPVCYEMAPDEDNFIKATGLTWDEIVDLHVKAKYLVYMIGFLPGFLYMGEVDPKIQLPRKKVPRKRVEKGSVGIAGIQTGIYPMESPGGWNILGRTPLSLFNPDQSNPFPIEVGSEIQFFPVSKKEFELMINDDNYQIERLDAR